MVCFLVNRVSKVCSLVNRVSIVCFLVFSLKKLELFLGGGHVIKLASDGGLYPSFLRVLIPSLYIGKEAVFFLIPIHGRFSGSSFLDGFGGGLHHLFFLRSSSSSSEESELESLSELQLQCGSHTDESTSHKKCPFSLSEKKKKIRSAGMTPKKKIRSTGMIPSGNTLKDHGPPGLLILKRIQLDRTQKDKDYVTRLYDSSTLCRYQVCLISFMSSSNLLYVFVKLALSLVNFMFCQK